MIKRGYKMWNEFIERHQIPRRDTGQMIVAKVMFS